MAQWRVEFCLIRTFFFTKLSLNLKDILEILEIINIEDRVITSLNILKKKLLTTPEEYNFHINNYHSQSNC